MNVFGSIAALATAVLLRVRLAAPSTADLVPAVQLAPGVKKKRHLPPPTESLQTSRPSMRLFAAYLCALCVLVPNAGHAQLIGTNKTYDERLRGARNVVALDETLFGDKINLQDGRVVFEQDDVVLATNSDLKVQIGRKTPPGSRGRDMAFSSQGLDREFAVFGIDWELNVPYMMGTYDERASRFSGCSAGNFVPTVYQPSTLPYEADPLEAYMFTSGLRINIPGQGEEQLLKVNSGQTLPADGKTYVGTTKSSWRVRCLSAIKNGPGEGFAAVLPDGTTYYFDWMAVRDAVDLTMNGTTDENGDYWDYGDLLAPLVDGFLYATRIEDRFGNFVSYTYDANHPNRIKSIESNDGVRLDVEYNASGQIYKVKSGNRTWTYSYVTLVADNGFKRLTSIELPDGAKWGFSFQRRTAPTLEGNFWKDCAADPEFLTSDPPIDPARFSIMTMTHPSGAKGEFKFLRLFHGTNNTPGRCNEYTTWSMSHPGMRWWGTEDVPSAYAEDSLYEKKISGSGISSSNLVWNYKYYPSWSFTYQCGAGCPTTSQTTVQTSDGVLRRYTFGNSYSLNFGQMLAETVERNGVVHLAKNFTYLASASGQSFPDRAGIMPSLGGNFGDPITFKNRPLRIATTQLDGVTFKRSVNTFDPFVRPLSVTKSSTVAGSPSKTEVTAYHDNLSKWILGQVARVTVNGTLASETAYSSVNALPLTYKAFGKLQQSLGYDTSSSVASGQRGTVKMVKDGNGHATALTNWKRGVPQSIRYADSTTQSAVINDAGWITRITDENGYATNYAYDPMGRLSQITYPTGDSTGWNATSFVFERRAGSAYGLPGGHWRQVASTGNGRKLTYFDALWRPVLVREYDAGNVAATSRFTRYTYDREGRTTFTSYPIASISSLADITQGVRTSYDALGRTIKVVRDSELGPLTTASWYGSNSDGYYTKVTDPRGEVTRTWYQAFDQPSYDSPMAIWHPGGAYTDIVRDVFGKPKSITRRNQSGTVASTRSYIYNAYQELCKTVEPETGATVMDYDGAGNLAWSKSGSVSTNTHSCNTTSIPENLRTKRTYDRRNRLVTLGFPDGRGNQIWKYWPDGLPKEVVTYNTDSDLAVNTYTYNKRRLLEHESMGRNGTTPWNIAYAYNANGHLSSLKYPSGLAVTYAPNALGQPTQAGAYATGVMYHPNGAIARFTYGNGLVHTTTQNLRGLPERIRDAGTVSGVDESYDYDANGNVLAISDGLPGARRNVDMAYDGLDRLTRATSPMFGGSGTPTHAYYAYDVLDNLTWVKNLSAGNARNHYYCYDAKWQLTSVKTGSCSGATVMDIGYDAQGNLADKNGQRYTFDSGNRLREAVGKETYWYDGYGRRVQANSLTGQGGIVSHYSQRGQLLYQQDYRAAKRYEYVYLGGRPVAYEETSSGSARVRHYRHTDALGSVVALTSATPTVMRRMEYEPYGQRIGAVNDNRPGHTGHVMDAATGLTYMQQRYYDPVIGRFLSVDPVTANSGTGANFNRYWYANNNPYRFTDPDGRFALDQEEEPPPPPEPDKSEPTTLATITVTATRPVLGPRPTSIPWGGIGRSLVNGGSIPLTLISGMWPYDMGYTACEMQGPGACGMMSSAFPPGYWPGDRGADEWGRRNGVGAKEGRGRFHGIKQSEKGQGGGRGNESYGVNPDTGDVVNPAGEVVGNLDEVKSK